MIGKKSRWHFSAAERPEQAAAAPDEGFARQQPTKGPIHLPTSRWTVGRPTAQPGLAEVSGSGKKFGKWTRRLDLLARHEARRAGGESDASAAPHPNPPPLTHACSSCDVLETSLFQNFHCICHKKEPMGEKESEASASYHPPSLNDCSSCDLSENYFLLQMFIALVTRRSRWGKKNPHHQKNILEPKNSFLGLSQSFLAAMQAVFVNW